MEEGDDLPGLDDNLLIERLELVDSGDHMAPVSSRLMLTGRLETARERDQAKQIGKAIAQADGPRLVQLLKDFREGPPRALARVLESINDMMQDGGMDPTADLASAREPSLLSRRGSVPPSMHAH